MTVAELITELQKMPQGKPVRYQELQVHADEEGHTHAIGETTADIDRVLDEGAFVLLRGR